MRDDCVAVQTAMAVWKKARHRALDVGPKRRGIRREHLAAFAPPADGAAPEQFLPGLGALLHLEPFATQSGTRLAHCGQHLAPPRLAVTGRPVDRLVETSIVLAPPVAEKVFVRTFADLHDGRAALLDA